MDPIDPGARPEALEQLARRIASAKPVRRGRAALPAGDKRLRDPSRIPASGSEPQSARTRKPSS